jgi:hypothetical protein
VIVSAPRLAPSEVSGLGWLAVSGWWCLSLRPGKCVRSTHYQVWCAAPSIACLFSSVLRYHRDIDKALRDLAGKFTAWVFSTTRLKTLAPPSSHSHRSNTASCVGGPHVGCTLPTGLMRTWYRWAAAILPAHLANSARDHSNR